MGIFSTRPELFKKLPKIAGIGGLIAGGIVALPIAGMAIRNSRMAKDDDIPLPPELTAPIPQVMEYIPPAQPTKLMNQELVEGDFVKRYKSQRAGLNAGPDTSVPNLTRADGQNAIDGSRKPIEDLNAPVGRSL